MPPKAGASAGKCPTSSSAAMTLKNLLLAVSLLALAVAGCGGKSKTAKTPDADSTLDGAVDATADANACEPTAATELSCNQIDDDCDGIVDNVDVGEDGINDCLRIGILGSAGTFGSSNFTAWLNSKGTVVTRISGDDADNITAAILANYDVIILDALTRTYNESEGQALYDFVEAGGGVMSMTGYGASTPDWDNPNSLLAKFGLAYDGSLYSGPVTMFDESHPIVAGLTSVTFSGGRIITEIENVTAGTNTTVATLAAGDVGVVQELGAGRVFVWGDEWIEFDSEWSSMPQIPLFWANILGWLAPVN